MNKNRNTNFTHLLLFVFILGLFAEVSYSRETSRFLQNNEDEIQLSSNELSVSNEDIGSIDLINQLERCSEFLQSLKKYNLLIKILNDESFYSIGHIHHECYKFNEIKTQIPDMLILKPKELAYNLNELDSTNITSNLISHFTSSKIFNNLTLEDNYKQPLNILIFIPIPSDEYLSLEFLQKMQERLRSKSLNIDISYPDKKFSFHPRLLEASSPDYTVTVVVILITGLIGFIIFRIVKKYCQKKNQSIEKKRFVDEKIDIPTKEEQSMVREPKKTHKKFDSAKQPLNITKTPTGDFKGIAALNLEDNGNVSVEPVNNILTNLEDSPKSLGDESASSSLRDTPKNIDFKIEFSILDVDSSKLKTYRTEQAMDQDENQ